MSFITSGAWARPIQDAKTAWLLPGRADPEMSFENNVAKDIYDITLNRAVAYGGFFVTATSVEQAKAEIATVFEAACKLDGYPGGQIRLSEAEATIALAALNLASNGEYYISAKEAKNAHGAIFDLDWLMGRNCRTWGGIDKYCEKLNSTTGWGRLFGRARDVLYSPNQECNPTAVMELGLLFASYDANVLGFSAFTPDDLFCSNTEKYYGEDLEDANEHMTTAVDSMTKFYPQYWR